MKVTFNIIIYFLLSLNIFAMEIDENSSDLDILSSSYIFIDNTNTLTKEEVLDREFTQNFKGTLGLGFVPNKALWIRFTLKNTSDKPIKKVLEYANAVTENLYFYDRGKVILDGMWHIKKDRQSIHPTFKIVLNPHEERTFYIKAHSKISTLIAKLSLYSNIDFIKHDYEHKTYFFVFFAIIFTLLLYNFMLYIFTKDIAYFYYVVYLSAVIFFQSFYLGVSQLYFFSNFTTIFVTKATVAYISFLVFPIILFTMEFLNTKQFKNIHNILKTYLYIIPIVILLSFDNFVFDLNVLLFFVPLGIITIYSGFYALSKGVKQAKYYVLGWSFVIVSLLLMILKSAGGYDITKHFLYINELAFILEALLFSIALAHRIKILAEEKSETDKKLIMFQKKQHDRLEELVKDKTKELSLALGEKDILYKELNHRVKNNLQMVLSLIKLQINKSDSKNTTEELSKTKNRINSIANLYDILYLKSDKTKFDTLAYFKNIAKNISDNFNKNVDIEYSIKYNIDVKSLVYCGLILNELITNSFKYAFKKSGIITIEVYKVGKTIQMIVRDDGVGFNKNSADSLGLTVVKTLAENQLHGKINIESNNGTTVIIEWIEDA